MPDRKELLQDFYAKYAPDQELTDERLNAINVKYGDDNKKLLSDFYSKYAPDQELSDERYIAIENKYNLKKKEPTIPPLGQAFKLGGESTPQLPLTSQSRLGENPKAVNDFNTKYGTNYTLKQLAGKEPILPQDETSFVMEKIESVKRGSERLGQMIANTPSFLYDIAAYPQNKIAELTGLNIGTSAKEFAQNYNLPENEVANYYKKAADESQSKIAAKYDKGVTEYFFGANPDYKKGFGLLTNQIAESLPITLSLMMGNAAGLSATASTFGGGVVFGAGKKEELEQANPNMPQSIQVENALGNGLMEGLFEQYGLTKLGSLGAKLIKEKGKDEAKKIITEGFKETYLPILKKYLGIGAEESAGEAATQFAQNVIDKYSGQKPDLNLADGVADAAMVGIGSSIAFSTPTAAAEILSVSKDRKKAKEILGKKIKVEEQIANPNTTPEAKQALVEVAKDLTSESSNIFNKAKIELQNIPEEEMFQLKEMSAKIEQLDNASQDETLDPELKKDLEIKYEEANKQLDEKIDELNKKYNIITPQEITTEPTSTEGVEASVVGNQFELIANKVFLDTHAIIQPILQRMNNAEYINEKEVERGTNELYDLLDSTEKRKDLSEEDKTKISESIEELINKLENYEFTTTTKTKTVTEKQTVPIPKQTSREVKQTEAPLRKAEGSTAEVETANGNKVSGTLNIRSGQYVIDNKGNQIVLGEAAITDRDLKLGDRGIELDPETDQVSSITLDINGNQLTITNPEIALDLAIKVRLQEIPFDVDQTLFDETMQEVEVKKEITTEELKPQAKRVEAISVEEQQAIDEAIPNLTEPLKREIKGLTTIENLMSEGVLEYVDEQTGEPCIKHGIRGNSFKRGSEWEIVKDLKGYKTHEQGGVDLTIGSDGIKIKNGKTDYYAKNGLLMPNN